MQSRLTILLFADLVGYSAMMDQDAHAAIETVRELKTSRLEPVAKKAGGTVLKRMGDGWIIEFPSIKAALETAKTVQNDLFGHPAIKLRIACHLGEIIQDDDDFYGAGVNIAQRIQTEAPPGGLMISEDLHRQLADTDAASFSDAGQFSLKNISQPLRLYQWRPKAGADVALGDVPSIAVHALGYAPADPETESLAADIRDQLVARLSKRNGISVFDGRADLGDAVTYDLEGRLRLSGNMGRVSLTLTLRSEARPVWSETYQASVENVFEFCDDIIERAESDLRLQTNAFDGARLASIPDNDLSVSELRARAATEFYKVTYESWQRGLSLMNRGLSLNPIDGVSLAMRAEAELMLHGARYEPMSPDKLTALTSDLDLAIVQVPRSDYIFWVRGMFRVAHLDDPAGAQSDLEHSAHINPTYLENIELKGHIAMRHGDFTEAERAYSRIVDSRTGDPLQICRRFHRAVARFCNEDYQGALADLRRTADLRPKDSAHYRLAALAAKALGNAEEATNQTAMAESADSFPAISTRRPVLPDNFAWLAARLAPG